MNLHKGKQASQLVSKAFAAKYPGTTLTSGWNYERPCLYLRIWGITDKEKQEEIRDWLVMFKRKSGETIEIWLTFSDKEGSELVVFKL